MSDPFFDDVAVLLHFDADTSDSGPDGLIPSVDTASISATSKWGAGALDANSGELRYTTGDVSLLADATMECWIYPTATTVDSCLVSHHFAGAGNNMPFVVGFTNPYGGTDKLFMGHYNTTAWQVAVSTYTPPLNTWTFIRAKFEGTSMKVWAGGVLILDAVEATVRVAATSELKVGQAWVSTKFVGLIDDMRLTDTARPETTEIPTEAFPDEGVALVPTIDTQPQPQTVTEGNNAVYTVAATTSGGTLLYQWYETTAGILGGETADTLTITTVLGDNGNGYYVIVTDDNGAIQSDTAALTVNAVAPPPSTSTLFDDSKGFPSEEYENAIDRITFMMQELEGSLCDCRDDPSVVVCVALLSSTGIYNTELQGGGEPDPVFGETLTLGVGVSGTGPYTYQWKVDTVDVVGATSLTFEYAVTGNASITVQVTNECSTILVGPYLIAFCEGYDCDALAETGRVVAEAYWPMTEPMFTIPTTRYFHAGATYGPYDAGDTANGWGAYYIWGDVPQDSSGGRSITFANFNYCTDDTASYANNYFEWASYFGYPAIRLHWQEAEFRPQGPSSSSTVTHILRENTDLSTLYRIMGYTVHRELSPPSGAAPAELTYASGGGVTVGTTTLRGLIIGGTAFEDINHTMDISKPYVVTTTVSQDVVLRARDWDENQTVVFLISQGTLNYQITLNETKTLSNSGFQNNNTELGPFNTAAAVVDIASRGAQQYLMGIAYNGDHAAILDGLNRNYEDYECP